MSRTFVALSLIIAFLAAACCSKPMERPMAEQQSAFDERPRLLDVDPKQLGDNVSSAERKPTIEELMAQIDGLHRQLREMTSEEREDLERRLANDSLRKERLAGAAKIGSRGGDVTCLEDEIQKRQASELNERRRQEFEAHFPELIGQLKKAEIAAFYALDNDQVTIAYSIDVWPRRYWWRIGGTSTEAWLEGSWEERSKNEKLGGRVTFTDDLDDMRTGGKIPRLTGTLAECVTTLINLAEEAQRKK